MSKIDVEAVVVAWLNGILPSGLDAYGDKPDPAPVVASDVPLMTIPMPASSFGTLDLGILGKRFATGIAHAIVGAIGDTDATNAVVGVKVNGTYI